MPYVLAILTIMANFSELAVIRVRALPPDQQAAEAAVAVEIIKELRDKYKDAKNGLGEFADKLHAQIEVVKTRIGGKDAPPA